MPQSCQDRIRLIANRLRESQSHASSQSAEAQLQNLRARFSDARGSAEEKVLCLCHSCGERTLGCIENPSKLREPYWMNQRTVLRHLQKQQADADQIIATLGRLLLAAREPDGVRYIKRSYYMVLAEICLKLQGQEGPGSVQAASATVDEGLQSSPHLMESGLGMELSGHQSDAHDSDRQPAGHRQARRILCSSSEDEEGIPDLSAPIYQDEELPEYSFAQGLLIGHWNRWPSLLEAMSGGPPWL